MEATDVLKEEHKVVLAVVSQAEREAQEIRRNVAADAEKIRKFVDFFRNFVDKCHHAKEEKHLFPKLEERGIPNEGGPVGMMLLEHTEGRAHVAAMPDLIEKAEHGDRKAADALAKELLAYGTLLRGHIDKENECLFAMADSVLSADDQEGLCRAFDAFESAETGRWRDTRGNRWLWGRRKSPQCRCDELDASSQPIRFQHPPSGPEHEDRRNPSFLTGSAVPGYPSGYSRASRVSREE